MSQIQPKLVYMKQLKLNVTPEFERDLRNYMRRKSIPDRSDAIRQALREVVAGEDNHKKYDYRKWLGLGLKAPLNRRRRFKSEDEIWSQKRRTPIVHRRLTPP